MLQPDEQRERIGEWSRAVLLILATLLVYSRVRHAGFIWDDESHLTENPCIIGPLGFVDIWTTPRAVYYPLVLTTFWVVHEFAGVSPLPYHLLNVLWHVGSGLLLWRVLRQLGVRGAWFGAMLWVLHPVLAQSVAWITEMKNTQSAFFYLLAISLFLNSQWGGGPGKRDPRPFPHTSRRLRLFYWLALLSFIAAVTSKPSTVILPIVLALCVWWRQGKLPGSLLRELAPFVLIALAASAWTVWEQKFHAGATGPEWVQTPLQRLLISASAIWFYLAKLAWPHPLIFIYPRWQVDPAKWTNYLPLVAVFLAGGFLFMRRSDKLRPLFFASSYYIVALFPVLDFFDVYFFRYSFVSDHFQYLASMGPLALAGAALAAIEERHTGQLSSFLWASICVVLGVLTFQQTAKYRDDVTLYRATLADNPSCWMADYNLGVALRRLGDLDGAIAYYRRAIASRPDYVEAHYNLAGALIEQGEIPEAIDHYRRAIQLHPDDPDSHNNYGNALRQLGRLDEAEHEYRRALELRSDYFDARVNLGTVLTQRGRATAAIEQFQEAVRLQPNDGSVRGRLGNALMAAGRNADAASEFSKAVAIAPDNIAALNSFAWLSATAGDANLRNGSRAVELGTKANELTKQEDPLVLHTLAAAYAEAGRFDAAQQTARRAMTLASRKRDTRLVNALADEISLYELRLPYHQASSQR